MGWSSQIVTASLVIIQGANDGLFIYNGTPALGNPPIISVTMAAADPFGNTITYSGETITNTSLQIANVLNEILTKLDQFGNILTFNIAGHQLLVWGNSPYKALMLYEDSAGTRQGPMIVSAAAQAASDVNGWAYPEGLATYASPGVTVPSLFAAANAGGSGTSQVVTTTATVAAGTLVAVAVSLSSTGPTVSSVADSAGNSYTLQQSEIADLPLYVYTSVLANPLPSGGTVTATFSSATVSNVMGVQVPGGSAVDVHPGAQGASGTSASVATGTLAAAREWVVAFEHNGIDAPSLSAPFTALATLSGAGAGFLTGGWALAGTAAGITATATWTPSSASWSVIAVALLPSGTGGILLGTQGSAPATPAGGCRLYYLAGHLYAVGSSGTPVLLATT